jgi:hypothetical protein
MSKEEVLDRIGRSVIHAKTEEIAKALCKKFHELEFTWGSGSSYLNIYNWNEFKHNTVYYLPSMTYGSLEVATLYKRKIITAEEFLSWFEEKPKKKRVQKPKPCKREKIETNLKQIREDADKAETRAFKCEYDSRVIGEYVDGEYSTCSTCSPEEAIVFAKWILDLEGK